MKLTFLGTGTSTGVPQIGCRCEVCRSSDPLDRRLRASALVETDSGKHILIDCGPDFREQILRVGTPALDCALLTHSHYDHVGGLDDLRPYCADGPFPLYCQKDVSDDLHDRLPYCFKRHVATMVPSYDIHKVKPGRSFRIEGDDLEITPLRVMHYKLPILGFRLGRLAYVTDCKTMPRETVEALRGVDTLVLNALRFKEHISHLSLSQALELIGEIKPREAYLTHMSHGIGFHSVTAPTLPENVFLAHDFQTITV